MDVLIINITSKQVSDFTKRVKIIETPRIKKVIFASSTSVVKATMEFNVPTLGQNESPLLTIKTCFETIKNIKKNIKKTLTLKNNKTPAQLLYYSLPIRLV
jgi:hypothetical protein